MSRASSLFRWFVTGALLLVAGRVAVLATPASLSPAPRSSPPAAREFRLVLDPGHGGRGEQPGLTTGDAWDASQGRFLRVLNFGGAQRLARGVRITEHEMALDLARRLKATLDLTRSEAGWAEFAKLLETVGVQGPLTRVRFDARLSREDDFRAREARKERDPSKDFRLLDSPESFPAANGQPLHPGRVSRVVETAPDLVIVLHLNDGPGTRERGTNALYVPSPSAFESLRQFALGKGPWTDELQRIRPHWLARGRARGEKPSMLESAWCYFTGFPPAASGQSADLRHPAGRSWNHVTWAFREPEPPRLTLEGPFSGPFRERERLPAEQRRRGGGPEGVGGDNLYAGQELLRFARLALARDPAAARPPAEVFGATPSLDTYLGPRDRPLCAAWTLPLLVNSVTAYLELGYISNFRDRWLLTNKRDRYIAGLAAGIYSLAAGAKVEPLAGVERPRGRAIDWSAYVGHAARARWPGARPPAIRGLAEPPAAATPATRRAPPEADEGEKPLRRRSGRLHRTLPRSAGD